MKNDWSHLFVTVLEQNVPKALCTICHKIVSLKGTGPHAAAHARQRDPLAVPGSMSTGATSAQHSPAVTDTNPSVVPPPCSDQPPQGTEGRAQPSVRHDPVYNHSVNSNPFVHSDQQKVNQEEYADVSPAPRLRLPPANNKKFWKEANDDLGQLLSDQIPAKEVATGDISAVVDKFDKIVHDYFAERCGTLRKPKGPVAPAQAPAGDHRVQQKVQELKKQAQHVWQSKDQLVRDANAPSLSRIIRLDNQLKRLNETAQNDRTAQAEQRRFRHDSNQYAAGLFKPRSDKQPTFDKAAADEYFTNTYWDKTRGKAYTEPPPGLQRPPPPTVPFDDSVPTEEDIRKCIHRKPNRSAPGLNGITYVVYKRCPSVLAMLTAIIQRVWREGDIPRAWLLAMIILISKSNVLDQPSEFRPIALLNTSGKIFFSIFNGRLERHMVDNGYINIAIQKAFLSGVPGCIEHTAKLDEALRLAKELKRPICVSFIDLENAYGSVKHNHLQFALNWYHVPATACKLIFQYYECQMAQVHTDKFRTVWFQMGKGVFQGCTGSTGLFNVAFNLLLDGINQPHNKELGFRLPDDPEPLLLSGYADDVSLVTEAPDDNQRVMDEFQLLLEWTGSMRLKPGKCRSFAMRRFINGVHCKYKKAQPHLEHSAFDPLLKAQGKDIKFIGDDDEPFKFLGKLISADLLDTFARHRLASKLSGLLEIVDQQPLRGWMKMWLYNFYIATKLSWMLMIYDLPLTEIEELEATSNKYLKKWLGLQRSAVTEILYVKRKHHGFQIHSLVTLYKRLQLIRCHLLKHSKDERVRRLYERDKQRVKNQKLKWDRVDAFELREAMALNKARLNEQIRSRHGIGFEGGTKEAAPLDSPAVIRQQISKLEADASDEERLARLDTLQMQGLWSRWDHIMQKDFSWRRMFAGAISDAILRFVVNAQLLTLPSEDNLRRWGKASADSVCRLEHKAPDGTVMQCKTPHPTALHVLTGCKVALEQGRYTWRHDSLLLVLKQHIVPHVAGINTGRVRFTSLSNSLRFRREDGTWYNDGNSVAPLLPVRLDEYLALSNDWEVKFDLPGDKYSYEIFPPEIAAVRDRPDVLLISRVLRVVLCIELTCPVEERVLKAHDLKKAKYDHLVADAEANGWRLSVWPIEVGCRGFVALSTVKVLKAFRFTRSQQATIKRQLEDVAERCSFYIFMHRRLTGWVENRPLLATMGSLVPADFSSEPQ
jgi:hypothetical protein